MMIAEEIAQTMIPEDNCNCTAQRYHLLGEFKNKRLCHLHMLLLHNAGKTRVHQNRPGKRCLPAGCSRDS